MIVCIVLFSILFTQVISSPVEKTREIPIMHDEVRSGKTLSTPLSSTKIPPSLNEGSSGNPEEKGSHFEGDIIMTPKTKSGLTDTNMLWKNGRIPFEIKGFFSPSDLNIIQRAVKVYHRYTCIRFVAKRPSDTDYVSITNDASGCNSYVGRQKGRQVVNLQSPSCTSKLGTVLHEFMHTCGFFHEQNRPDRENYVTINYPNIRDGYEGNFAKSDANTVSDFGIPYDYGSVMHYSDHAFSKNGKPTITANLPIPPGIMGQRNGFSTSDLLRINILYNCTQFFTDASEEEKNENNIDSNQGNLLSNFLNIFKRPGVF